jgi:uncharacterized Zn-binding protein involved in type VI secretion
MGKMVVVKGDAVQGTDQHNVSGNATNPAPPPPPTVPYTGVGSYTYTGKMTDGLSTFVKIGGQPVALVTSKSSLNPGETAPGGGHNGASGSNFVPPAPVPIPDPLLLITDSVGTGVPNAAAGSALLTIGGVKVLLDGDKIDTCDGLSVPANSTVTASGQSFVGCSA